LSVNAPIFINICISLIADSEPLTFSLWRDTL
jgi:hypothetical protein